jgi:hypothetical protein
MMNASRIVPVSDAPHVCPCCDLPLVQPVDWECAGEDHWLISLLCPSCEWAGERILTDERVERFEGELDEGLREVHFLLARITKSNMRDYAARFTAALAAGSILPEDF